MRKTECRQSLGVSFHLTRGNFHQLQWTIHWFSPKLSTSPDLGPIEDVPRYYLKKLGATHGENLRATVESLESIPESQVSIHLLANASIENCRNEVLRIANILVQESQAEVCRTCQRLNKDGAVVISGLREISSDKGAGG